MADDLDKLLRRRLMVQRYVASQVRGITAANRSTDRQLISLLSDFVMDADAPTLAALSRLRTSNAGVRTLLASVRDLVKVQHDTALALILDDLPELIDQELEITASSVESEPPSPAGVSTLPVAGTTIAALIGAAFVRYGDRLRSEIVMAAGTDAANIPKIVRGTRAQQYKDGLLSWRDRNLIAPNVDMAINGVAANARTKVYRSSGVKYVTHTATLDFRVCLECAAYEAAGPYEAGTEPSLPVHPNCRCLNLPYRQEQPQERPQVRDVRSVKDIPEGERNAKIRINRDTMAKFFDRLNKRERIEVMGASRAALWEAGKVTDLRGFVNQVTGAPLRLDQLPRL